MTRDGSPSTTQRPRVRSLGTRLASALARLALAAWRRPAFAYGLLMALAVGRLGTTGGELLPGVPSTLVVTLAFFALALWQRRWTHAWSAWRACAAAFWLYTLVCLIESVSVLYRGGTPYLPFALGRWSFLAICVTTAAMAEDVDALRDMLSGNAYAAGIIGLLTVLHATRVLRLPFALSLMPARTFGPIHMPVPRTLGVAMSPDKFAMIAALTLVTIGLTYDQPLPVVRPRWVAALLALLAILACLIAQTRAVYISILFALALIVCFRLLARVRRPWFSGAAGAWAAVLLYALALVAANVAFSRWVPIEWLDTGTSSSIRNVEIRIEVNALALQMFRRWPWLGIGHDRFEPLTLDDNGIHNVFLEQMVATGLVGGVPYWLFHALILVAALRACGDRRPALAGLGRVLAPAVLVVYLTYQFFPGFLNTPFAVLSGLVAALARERRRATA